MCACRGTAGFAHVSCLAEQAKILIEEAEENNLGAKALFERNGRWSTCSLCEQIYHGVVAGALGWACWKTYVGRPENDKIRFNAMNLLGNGLFSAKRHEDALSVYEAQLSMRRRHGDSGETLLVVQDNLANSYQVLGRHEEAHRVRRDVYSARLKLNGEEDRQTLGAAHNYASSLIRLQRFEETKALMRKTIPVARRVLGEYYVLTLMMRWIYAEAVWRDYDAPLDDVREAVTGLEDLARDSRRVLGGAHPRTTGIERSLRGSREVLRAREEGGVDALREAMAAILGCDAATR